MYAAVWWVSEKKWSVIETSTITAGDVSPGNTCYAEWNKVPYEVKVLRKSDDFKLLSALKVNSDGTLKVDKAMARGLNFSKKVAKKKETFIDSPSTELAAVFDVDSQLINCQLDEAPLSLSQPILPDLPKASPEVIKYFESMLRVLKKQAASSVSNTAVPVVVPVLSLRERQPGCSDSKASAAGCSGLNKPKLRQQLKASEEKKSSNSQSAVQETLDQIQSSETKDIPFPLPEIDDPVILIPGYNVKISKKERKKAVKLHRNDQRGMIKSVLVNTLGVPNLKTMRARNHGKSEYDPIPSDYIDAVETFLVNYCTSYDKTKFNKTVNNILHGLRNPARIHKKGDSVIEEPKQKRSLSARRGAKSKESDGDDSSGTDDNPSPKKQRKVSDDSDSGEDSDEELLYESGDNSVVKLSPLKAPVLKSVSPSKFKSVARKTSPWKERPLPSRAIAASVRRSAAASSAPSAAVSAARGAGPEAAAGAGPEAAAGAAPEAAAGAAPKAAAGSAVGTVQAASPAAAAPISSPWKVLPTNEPNQQPLYNASRILDFNDGAGATYPDNTAWPSFGFHNRYQPAQMYEYQNEWPTYTNL